MRHYIATETDKYLIKNGRSDYRILVPVRDKKNEYIAAAAEDLQKFLLEATGAALEIVDDTAILSEGKFFAIGDTKYAGNAFLGADEAVLGIGGAIVRTVGDSVCMTGATAEAAMYAVYIFLEKELDFDLYYTDFYDLKRNIKDLKLKNYDIVEIPDFEYRIQSSGWIRYCSSNIKRMRWTDNYGLFIPADGEKAVWHNSFAYLPPETYRTEHPDWYSEPSASQLCYSAHGNESERRRMIDIVAERIETLFKDERFRSRRFISVSVQDNTEFCTCPACRKAKEKYGADSALVVRFCNDVSRRVRKWQESEAGQSYARDYRLMFFAYHATNVAPAVYNPESDSYRPVDESVVCDKNVAVYFAETGGDYTQNLRDRETANTFVGDNMRAWRSLSEEIYFWSYSTNFFWFFTPYNSFDAAQDIYRFAREQGCRYIMTQDQWIQANAQTGWGIYKNWLHSKLGWNADADIPALTDKFFKGYFREAHGTMRVLFESWRAWARYQTKELGYKGAFSIYYNPLRRDWWPVEKLDEWLDLIGRAYKEIEIYKEADCVLYRRLREHICIESIDYRYLLIELYSDRYSEADQKSVKRGLIEDIRRIGMDKAGAKVGDMTTLCAKWGF